MDAYEKHLMKSAVLDNMIETIGDADLLYLEINKCKEIDIEEDFSMICTAIQFLHPQLFNTFIEVLMEKGLSNIVMQNLEEIGIKNIIDIAIYKEVDEFKTYISENLEQVITKLFNTTYFDASNTMKVLSLSKDQEEIKNSLKIAIRKMSSDDRIKMIYKIPENKNLGNIEEYLDDLLFNQTVKTDTNLFEVIRELEKSNKIDQMKLLQALERNIDNIICDTDKNFLLDQVSFLDTIKEIEEESYKDTNQALELIEKINTCISNNFEVILDKYGYEIQLIDVLRKFDIDNSKFLNVQDKIIEYLNEKDLIKYIQSTKGKEGFDKDWDSFELTRQMFKDSIRLLNRDRKIDETAIYTIGKIIQELCEHEKKEIKDIEFAGSGVFSFGVKIGDYILKLGKERETKVIPNHKRILKPLIRQDYNEEGRKDIADVTMEIQNYGNANWYKNLSQKEIEEKLYNIYKELRDDGIMWTDIKPENVVELLKPNKENFMLEVLDKDGTIIKQEMKSNNYAIGFTREEPEETLDTGEFVIVDTDYVYDENNSSMKIISIELYYAFEERYIREMKKEKLHEYLKKQIEKSMTDTSTIKNVSCEIEKAENEEELEYNNKEGTDRS